MSRKELNKTFMMISNCNKFFGLQGFYKKKFSALMVNMLITMQGIYTFDPFSAGIDFWRQNLTSKVDPSGEIFLKFDEQRPITKVFK